MCDPKFVSKMSIICSHSYALNNNYILNFRQERHWVGERQSKRSKRIKNALVHPWVQNKLDELSSIFFFFPLILDRECVCTFLINRRVCQVLAHFINDYIQVNNIIMKEKRKDFKRLILFSLQKTGHFLLQSHYRNIEIYIYKYICRTLWHLTQYPLYCQNLNIHLID